MPDRGTLWVQTAVRSTYIMRGLAVHTYPKTHSAPVSLEIRCSDVNLMIPETLNPEPSRQTRGPESLNSNPPKTRTLNLVKPSCVVEVQDVLGQGSIIYTAACSGFKAGRARSPSSINLCRPVFWGLAFKCRRAAKRVPLLLSG